MAASIKQITIVPGLLLLSALVYHHGLEAQIATCLHPLAYNGKTRLEVQTDTGQWYILPAGRKLNIDCSTFLIYRLSDTAGFCTSYDLNTSEPWYVRHKASDPLFDSVPLSRRVLEGLCTCHHCLLRPFRFRTDSAHYYLLYIPANTTLTVHLKQGEAAPDKPAVQSTFTTGDLEKLSSGKIQTGQSIRMENVLFGGNSSEILPVSYPQLEKLLVFLKNNPSVHIEIQGHVNGPNRDNSYFDDLLSRQRALAVYNYLNEHGIAEKRMTWKGFGNKMMLYPHTTDPVEMQKNRRVEVLITSK